MEVIINLRLYLKKTREREREGGGGGGIHTMRPVERYSKTSLRESKIKRATEGC